MTVRFRELYGSITLQSLPKPGRRAFGVPVGGPFDLESHTLANALLGNEPNLDCLELSACTGNLEVLEAGTLSWVGAGAFQGSRHFESGQILEIPYPKQGCRSYLGLHGGVVKVDEKKFASRSQANAESHKLAEEPCFPPLSKLRTVRSASCTDEEWAYLFSQEFAVDPHSNRLGVRLACSYPVTHSVEKISEPMEVGVIQLPPSGNPIIIGPDGPTIGGYPNLGTVVRADLSKVGQLAMGAKVIFRESTPDDAWEAFCKLTDDLKRRALLLRLGAGSPN